MTFLILYPLDDLGALIYKASILPESCSPAQASKVLAAYRESDQPSAFLAETLIVKEQAKGALPGELARAIEAWNAMPKEVTVPRLRGNLSRLVAPYRRWKKEAGERDYLLEQLVADVAATPFCWPWIRFPWLFGKKNGELNSEKLRSGQWKQKDTRPAVEPPTPVSELLEALAAMVPDDDFAARIRGLSGEAAAIEESLIAIEGEMLDAFEKQLPLDRRRAALATTTGAPDAATQSRTARAVLRRVTREHFGLPRLTIFR